MLLDGLDGVAWSRLTCTYGTGEDTPGWLRQLTSPSPKLRRAALWQLSNAFVHQDTVWSATVAAVPFLIELLQAPEIGSKDGILTLLGEIAEGWYSSYDATASGENTDADGQDSSDADDWDEDEDDEDDDSEFDEDEDARQPQRAAVRVGIPIYIAFLDDPDPAVRVAAIYVLGLCRSAAFDPLPTLDAAYQRERDPGVRACLLLARGESPREPATRRAFFRDALRDPQLSAVERLAAAEMLLDKSAETVSDETIDLLVNTLAYPSRGLEAAYGLATRLHRSLVTRIGYFLRDLAPERLSTAVPILTTRLPYIGRERQYIAISVLLKALFPATNGALLPAMSLTGEQRAALAAIFAAGPFWRDGLGVSLARFGESGLPWTRPALGDYLGLALPPDDALGAVEQPRPHRPAPFTIKAYQARIHSTYRYLKIRRTPGYRFEPGPEVDFYSPDGLYHFYFPKSPDAVLAVEREIALLSAVPALPLPRWHPADSSRDTRAAGRAFMGGLGEPTGDPLTAEALERLHGTKRWEQFARLLARCLQGLHATPLDTIRIALPLAEGLEAWERIYAEARARLFDELPREARHWIADRFETFLDEPNSWTWAPTIIHGDFSPRNIHYSTFRDGDVGLSGIAGWRHIGLGDPARDLASLLGPDGYGEEFVSLFADAYPTLDDELPRARFYASVQPVRDALAAAPGQEREAALRLLALLS